MDCGTSTGLIDLGGEEAMISFEGASQVGVTGATGVGGEVERARAEAMMLFGIRERGFAASWLSPLMILSGLTATGEGDSITIDGIVGTVLTLIVGRKRAVI
jgi:hypothetical protein